MHSIVGYFTLLRFVVASPFTTTILLLFFFSFSLLHFLPFFFFFLSPLHHFSLFLHHLLFLRLLLVVMLLLVLMMMRVPLSPTRRLTSACLPLALSAVTPAPASPPLAILVLLSSAAFLHSVGFLVGVGLSKGNRVLDLASQV